MSARSKSTAPAGKPAPAPRREREVQHIIRTNDAEAAEIEAAAQATGLKKGSWARMVLLREARRHARKD